MNTLNDIMILEEDVDKLLKDYELTIYAFLRDNDSEIHMIKESMKQGVLAHYNLSGGAEELGSLGQARYNYLTRKVSQTYHQMVSECQRRLDNKTNILETMAKLESLELPEQRSQEWYDMRDNVLTASSLADALGKGHFNTRESLLIDKTTPKEDRKPFVSHEIMEWGVKYEEVATKFYEKMNHLKILEFGLVPHPDFPIFGASPDGICSVESPTEYVGRMLEIKCPPKRHFTSEVPLHYWMQMQGQLETCDLEECDFLQVKLTEYQSRGEYLSDVLMKDEALQHGYSSNGLPKGLVLAFKTMKDGQPHYVYRYPELCEEYTGLIEWLEQTKEAYQEPYDECIESWYRIERYECTLVLRDRPWWVQTMPKIIDFWEDVEKYRKEGNQSLIQKRDDRKTKLKISIQNKKSKKEMGSPGASNVIQVNKTINDVIQNSYLLDSDDD